jgi:ABC-type phosphate/phosphonate transport system substrate-binding protein
MYPFASLRPAFDRLWQAVRERAAWVPERLEWDVDLHAQWRDPATVVGYTCGWPLVTELADLAETGRLHVVGSFVFAIPEADGPTYRSVLVARRPGTAADFAGALAAANGPDSLSGWVSLLHAVHGPGARWQGEVLFTGAHLESVRTVHEGRAEVASIDAVSLAHIRRLHPDLCADLVEVGNGPQVPCLPVIAGAAVSMQQLAELRAAFTAAVADQALADVRATLLVEAFVARDYADYQPLRNLAPAPQ